MTQTEQADHLATPLRDAVYAITAGDYDAAVLLLSDPLWELLESNYWNASHPLPPHARQALDTYLHLAKTLWHRAGLGQPHPIVLYKTTLLSTKAIETALRVLARIYAGCNLGFCAPPPGFWRTVYALTGYIISERFPDRENREALTHQVLQVWLMAWLNPLSLAPGRLPVAVRLVGILCKTCSFTLVSPTHAGSGLAASDLLSDVPPMPFARVPTTWEPIAPLYINAQDAAFTMRELATPPSRHAPSDVYEALLQSALQVGLSAQEMQDFVRRAMREFGYTNARSIPRVGREDVVSTVVGFIECWSALQEQAKPITAPGTSASHHTHSAIVENHSDGGFLLRYELSEANLCVGTFLCLRGSVSEPWTIAAVRWLEDSNNVVLVGCEVICNFADARIAQTPDKSEHLPIISFLKNEASYVLCAFDPSKANSVSQLTVDSENWVVAVASEIGEDWQLSAVLDVTQLK
ncbi:MAG: hypothetical protein H7203_08150 [Rhizobacter sp.]|nr:hypothetical protein [Burkholderiales bacterium]